MKIEILDEVIACLPKERTLFHYFKGQYAFLLLSIVAKQQHSVSAIKYSPFRSLLNQPQVKTLLACQGNGTLAPELFAHAWNKNSQAFVLTVDKWGKHNNWQYQTTRKGCNLVLQLNFSEQHNRAYQRLVKPEDDYIFNYSSHPVMERKKRTRFRNTLAWARIDFDLNNGEALIEEIQSDWVRRANYCLQSIKHRAEPWFLNLCQCNPEDFVTYMEKIFAPYNSLWSEAMLSATISFIYKELGISNIYYHTHESGGKIKQIYGNSPPRSLYSNLPRKFCFQKTHENPLFLENDRNFKRKKRSLKQVAWYQLKL